MRQALSVGGVTFDLRVTLIIVLGTIVPMLDAYNHSPVRAVLNAVGMTDVTHVKAYDRVLFYLLIPLLTIWFVFQDRPHDYGFRWGNWREGLLWVVVGCVGMSLVLWFIARSADMQSYYDARAPENPLFLIYITGVDLIGWEFIWRGFMLFGLARALGPGPAIFLQAVPFAFMHLGKPEVETLSTLFGGAAFGFIAWRTGSFTYPFFIHWFIASFTMLIASGRL